MKTIGELFFISSGLVSKRKEAPPDVEGFHYKILTLRSFNNKGFIEKENVDEFVSVEKIDDKYLARVGDIVIRLSNPFTAALIDQDNQGMIITSLFAILRPKENIVNPEYVVICLNSEFMEKQYLKDASGSALRIIKTSVIKDYNIKFPDLYRQMQIIELNRLMFRESNLLEKLVANKKQYNKAILDKLMEE